MPVSPISPTGIKPKKQRQWVRENYGKGKNPEAMTKDRKRELEASERPEGVSEDD